MSATRPPLTLHAVPAASDPRRIGNDPRNVTPPALRALPKPAAPPVTRADRVRAVAAMYGTPADLVEAFNERGLSVREVTTLLQTATGTQRTIGSAGIEAVRLGLLAHDHRRRAEAADNDAARLREIGQLCHRYGIAQTRVAMAMCSSNHALPVLEKLVAARANAVGRLDPFSQASLLRDLMRSKGAPR